MSGYVRPITKLPFSEVQDRKGRPFRIKDHNTPLASGGEGSIFVTTEERGGKPIFLKVYHPKISSPKHRQKIEAIVKRLPSHKNVADFSSHPLSGAYVNGVFVGFLMMGFEKGVPLSFIYNKRELVRRHPKPSWKVPLQVAASLAGLVYKVHEAGYVIGDMNPNNFLVNTRLEVFALDVDSFQFEESGTLYRCAGNVADWLHPDLHGQDFRTVELKREHDFFALSKLIFHLLMFGHDPYHAIYPDKRHIPAAQAIKNRHYPYNEERRQSVGMDMPPAALHPAQFSQLLAKRFDRAFIGGINHIPQASEWQTVLENVASEMKQCSNNITHVHPKTTACPMCAKEKASNGFYKFYHASPYHG